MDAELSFQKLPFAKKYNLICKHNKVLIALVKELEEKIEQLEPVANTVKVYVDSTERMSNMTKELNRLNEQVVELKGGPEFKIQKKFIKSMGLLDQYKLYKELHKDE